jgi:YHS domain-containing protein/thioredoxin-related protein
MRSNLFKSTVKLANSHTLILLLLVVNLQVHSVYAFETKPIERTLSWIQDYGEALKAAVEKQRPVWLQFTGPWCPNCHRMDKESFKNPGVIEQLTKHFITAKISCDDDAELALSFGFTQLPATVLISPDGRILAKLEGFADPEKLSQLSIQAGVTSEPFKQNEVKSAETKEFLAQIPVNEEAASQIDEALLANQNSAELIAGQSASTASLVSGGNSSEPADDQPAAPVIEAEELLASKSSRDATPLIEKPLEPLGKLCPVTLLDQKLEMLADASVTALYAGQRYYFANQEAKRAFAKNPERYVPARGGECVVSFVDEKKEKSGSSNFPVIYDDRIFLCAGSEQRDFFIANPSQYADKDVRLSGLCPHCMSVQHAQNKGSNLFQIRFGGSRYLFPDRAHMEAFLKSPLPSLK